SWAVGIHRFKAELSRGLDIGSDCCLGKGLGCWSRSRRGCRIQSWAQGRARQSTCAVPSTGCCLRPRRGPCYCLDK
ncbi:hypothetical protein JMJ77_0010842, partial [Colletotrichum scovillei]